jgi:hypothetical protein
MRSLSLRHSRYTRPIEEMKLMWKLRFPESVNLHVHYGRLLHLLSIFVSDFLIGLLMYQLFNYLH